MKLLHIAYLDEILGGVNTIVPQHVREEGRYAQTMLYNLYEHTADEIQRFDLIGTDIGRPDLIIFHEIYRPQFIGLYKKAMALDIPYIIVPHGSLTRTSQHKKFLKKALGNLLLFNRFIKYAQAVRCLSQNEYDHTNVKVEKFVSPNGISVDRVKEAFHTQHLKFVYVGRLEVEIKGIDLMLSAIRQIKADLSAEGVRIDLYGPDDGGCHQVIRNMIEDFGIGEIAALHPPVTGIDKTDVLLDADVFIQTSRTEGMSVGLLEAFATGLPSIVTEGTGMGEYVREYQAGYVAKCDPDSIAEAIMSSVAEKNVFPLMSESAVRLIRDHFSWNKIVPKCLERYRVYINHT